MTRLPNLRIVVWMIRRYWRFVFLIREKVSAIPGSRSFDCSDRRKRPYLLLRNIILVINLIISPAVAIGAVGDHIPIQGLEAANEGVVAWDSDGTGPAPLRQGHHTDWITCTDPSDNVPPNAYYYLASRDHVESGSSSGFHAIPGMSGFPAFSLALIQNGFTPEDLTMSWGIQDLGTDEQGFEWKYETPVETRFYSGGQFYLKVAGEVIVGGPMPPTILSIDYNNLSNCEDDQIFGETGVVVPVYLAKSSSPGVQAVAAAFMSDLNGNGIKVVFDSLQPAIQEEFSENGQIGGVFSIQTGRIEIASLSRVPWSWGKNNFGQLGDGTYAGVFGHPDRSIPGIISRLSDVVAMSGGWMHSLALKRDGTVWAWGANTHGQLGDGTHNAFLHRTVPRRVSGLNSVKVVEVASGLTHCLALDQEGRVWAWGSNRYGELGIGNNTFRTTPMQISGLNSVIAVATGSSHSLAIARPYFTVWSWGRNQHGQLGDGTNTDRNTPLEIPGLTGVKAIAAGSYHSLALKLDGTVWAWGQDYTDTPVQVSGLSDIVAITSGKDWALESFVNARHNSALEGNGIVWAWGSNGSGQLGDGTNTDRNVAAPINTLSEVIAIAAGGHHSLALTADGSVWTWGSNLSGQLGDESYPSRNIPARVVDPNAPSDSFFGGVTAITAGWGHNLVITDSDYDGDGITDWIDQPYPGGVLDQSDVYSNFFIDYHLRGGTFGEIEREGLDVSVLRAPGSSGVIIRAIGETGHARLNLCGQPRTRIDPGGFGFFSCYSLTAHVLSGPISINIFSDAYVTVPTGAAVKISEIGEGQRKVQNIGSKEKIIITLPSGICASTPLDSYHFPPPKKGKKERIKPVIGPNAFRLYNHILLKIPKKTALDVVAVTNSAFVFRNSVKSAQPIEIELLPGFSVYIPCDDAKTQKRKKGRKTKND